VSVKYHYVVMDHLGRPCFSADTFDHAAERVTALLKGQADTDPTIGFNYGSFHIVKVEAS
jgi:hypothetical protein